jgi:hypothetical protein
MAEIGKKCLDSHVILSPYFMAAKKAADMIMPSP